MPATAIAAATERMDGNRAAALAALDAGVAFFSHYPGSPVSRVEPELRAAARDAGRAVAVHDALNEHVAALAAQGASLCGARSLLVMKHVGLNIAADPLSIAGYAGLRGGMVVVVGTDPGARSSTGEQDVHGYADQFHAPAFEPADVQGVYDLVFEAFAVSEAASAPVLVFVPGRIANQSERVTRRPARTPPDAYRFVRDRQAHINVGPRAVANHRRLLQRLSAVAATPGPVRRRGDPAAPVGLLTRGATWSVTCEVLDELGLGDRVDHLDVARLFPLHRAALARFAAGKQRLLVIEDQDGYLERQLKTHCFDDLDCAVEGKEHFPAWGEVTHAQVRSVLARLFGLDPTAPELPAVEVAERPGTFCPGCPHRGAFFGIEQALRGRDHVLGGDIGCSSLPPHKADWLLCMNAGIGITQGIAQVVQDQVVVSTGGEGSLFHGGLLALQTAVLNDVDLVHVLLDNASVAMTGHQPSPTTGGRVDVPALLAAVGVTRVLEVEAQHPTRVAAAVREATERAGVSVVWVRGNCALQPDAETLRRRRVRTLHVEVDRCGSCSLCHTELACPAITGSSRDRTLHFDMTRCSRCAACLDICPHDAIRVTETQP